MTSKSEWEEVDIAAEERKQAQIVVRQYCRSATRRGPRGRHRRGSYVLPSVYPAIWVAASLESKTQTMPAKVKYFLTKRYNNC